MPCIIFYNVIRCYVFSEATTTVLNSFTNSTEKHLCWSLFFKKMMKLYKDIILFCMNKPYLCRIFFLTDWRYKCLKITIDLLLFYGEHFYGFSGSDLRKRRKNNIHFTTNISIYIRVTDILKFYEVLFCTYFKGLFCP